MCTTMGVIVVSDNRHPGFEYAKAKSAHGRGNLQNQDLH
mgnify:CR=1 FL=1